MKYETTPAFDADYRRLEPEHRAMFRDVLRTKFIPACDTLTSDPATVWPKSLRVKSVQGTGGVLEMTWSFASPDGRASFELFTSGAELHCRWRRIGDHDVFKDP
jgi:hypothetical protein